MTTFTVWKFDDPQGAAHAASIVKNAEGDGLVKLYDHAIVEWPEGESKPKSYGSHEDSAKAGGWGALWGLLIGTLFFLPVVGAAAGAAIGGLSRALSSVGIKHEDLEKLKREITPGTSALFLITERGDFDRLAERFHGVHASLISTNLTEGERDQLLEAFDS
ncbi:DUF1269 domain-containing protein [Microlunatus elymi]|uniref:DUF1269 domain-containing protein n=1 Tax=Microlunatus elymi TaxID=2596828 RepID=A0A516PZ86_9ACTN|nr:DUF1269 domain-containing protein [Microlunatus elymi]QDP96467.1 DUF1269 domain-containing protein [Microlunatus elymi]